MNLGGLFIVAGGRFLDRSVEIIQKIPNNLICLKAQDYNESSLGFKGTFQFIHFFADQGTNSGWKGTPVPLKNGKRHS